jgi:hypothetical protein
LPPALRQIPQAPNAGAQSARGNARAGMARSRGTRSVMGGIGLALSLRWNALRGQALALEYLGAMQPALGHLRPGRPARRIAGELRHLLTILGVSQELLGWIHGRLLLVPVGPAMVIASSRRAHGGPQPAPGEVLRSSIADDRSTKLQAFARALSRAIHAACTDLMRTPPVPAGDPFLTEIDRNGSRKRVFRLRGTQIGPFRPEAGPLAESADGRSGHRPRRLADLFVPERNRDECRSPTRLPSE